MKFVTGLYYLFLGLWFGAMVMLAVTAAVTFKTVRAQMPDATETAQNMFAGSIVGNVIDALAVIQIVCAAGILVCVALLWKRASPGIANKLRLACIAACIALLAGDRLHINPTVHAHRVVMHDPQAAPAVRDAAKVQFDRYHKFSERIGGAQIFILAGTILISPFALHRNRIDADENG